MAMAGAGTPIRQLSPHDLELFPSATSISLLDPGIGHTHT